MSYERDRRRDLWDPEKNINNEAVGLLIGVIGGISLAIYLIIGNINSANKHHNKTEPQLPQSPGVTRKIDQPIPLKRLVWIRK